MLIMSILQSKLKSVMYVALVSTLLASVGLVNPIFSQCSSTLGASSNSGATSGNQDYSGRLGMRFTVISPIVVNQLGAYDSDLDGISGGITVGIVNESSTVVVPGITISGSGDPLVGAFRMRNVPNVTLMPGIYTVVAFGFNSTDENYNSNNPANLLATTNTAGGLISHVDSRWDGTAALGLPANTFVVGGFHAGNFSFTGLAPTLSATLNGTTITANNDGADDTASFSVCNGATSNVSITAFSDGTAQSNIYVQQQITTNNATLASWCVNCTAAIGDFVGQTATAALINGSLPGSVTVRFRAFVDADGSDEYEAGECAGDWVVYTININPLPTLQATINTVQVTANNNGSDDTGLFTVCTSSANNIFFTQFTDLSNIAASSNVKVVQQINRTNVTFAPADGTFLLSDYATPFNRTVTLVNPALAGTLNLRFRIFYDANNNNIFDAGDCANDWVSYDVTVNPIPSLQTTINSVQITNNNDGVNDTGSFTVCHGSGDNLFFTQFADLVNVTPSANVKVIQQFIRTNVTFTPGDGVSPLSAYSPAFNRNVSLVNTAISGTLEMRFRIFYDANNNNTLDAGECSNDMVVYTVTVNAPVTSATITANPTGNVCLGATGVQYNALTAGGTSSLSYSWCAYNTNNGTGPCDNVFLPNNTSQSVTKSWNTPPPSAKSVRFTVSQAGCPDVLSTLYVFDVVADPVAPTLNIASPANNTGVCVGNIVSATFNPGTSGAGTCTDEYRFSANNGATWSPYTPGSNITMGAMTVIIQTRRVCDGLGCDGSGETYSTVASWTSNALPTASVTPDPAEVCILTNLPLNGNPSGGSGSYPTHLWTRVGGGSTYLNNNNVVNPIFNHNVLGQYTLQYRVTDSNGCTATDNIIVTVRDLGLPMIQCPTSPINMTADPDRCTSVVCFPVSATDLCPVNLPNTLPGHTFIGTYNGHTYFRSNSTYSWEAANAAAVAAGGHLVSINNAAENSWILSNTPAGMYWLGLRFSPSLNQFKWTNGQPVSYTNWGFGQPGFIDGDYVFSMEVGAFDLGWFDVPGLLPRRYIVEFEGFPVTLVSGLPSGSNFPVGTTAVRYRATDSAGNSSECTFNVVVTDDQNPTIACPANITVNLDPLECERVVNFNPIVSDNCPGATFNYLTDIESGDPFPIGINTVTVQAEDAAGNLSHACSFTVTVNDYINPSLGCKPIHFSVDGDCGKTLTPTEVLTGWEGPGGSILLGCLDSFKIEVTGPNGQNLGNVISGAFLGKTLNYSISHPNGFRCWNTVLIEDKLAPTIVCRDITVNCLMDLTTREVNTPTGVNIVLDADPSFILASLSDNCNVKGLLVNEVHNVLSCDPLYIGSVVRTYKAVDFSGNESVVCTSIIYQRRSSNMGIVPPPANRKLSCSSNFRTDDRGKGYPHPSVTGIPTFGGRNLWPQRQLDMQYCNALIDYTDEPMIETDCKTRVRRTWKITEWWCSTSVEIFVGVQMIDIVDEKGPVIPAVASSTLTTQSRSCTAKVALPVLNIIDSCNSVSRVYVNASNADGPSGYVNGNGGTMELGVGTHSITYTAFDNCSNSSTMTYRVTVQDETDPVAICDQFATVSLKTNGYTEVTANAVDDGSFDECGSVTLKIRRMEDPCSFGHDTAWYDKVGFCCLDANTTRMIQLLVTDLGGNTNICMVSVNVQDKVVPSMTCPGDLTIDDCLFTFDPSTAGSIAAFGGATVIDNCPSNVTPVYTLEDNRNQCGTGEVIRTIRLSEYNVLLQTCTQKITFRNNDPFYINSLNFNDPNDDIVWPKDYLALGQCSFAGLLPETLPDSSSVPRFTEDACDLVGMKYEDKVFPFTTNGACYKIIRTWTVIDWCQKDDEGRNLTWTYEQEIKVIDNVRPTLTVPTTTQVFNTSNCTSYDVTLSASATDCTPANELKWTYRILQNGAVIGSGNTRTVTDEFEVGEYRIEFTVEDRCGNVNSGGYNFSVRTTKSATAVCKKGLSAPLVPMGTPPTLMAMIPVEFFDNKSYHACGYTFQLSYSRDLNNDTLTFTTPGCKPIQMWVTDQNGNTSFCETFIDIQRDGISNNCDNTNGNTLVSTISGKTIKENEEAIAEVVVKMEGTEANPVVTNTDGKFVFEPMNNGSNYNVIPGKDGDDLNGVSTLDLVMIQRHILGLEKLGTPYKMIAADVNNSGSITASDLTELRKLILGLTPEFPNNTSWRFFDAAHKFVDPFDPWRGALSETYAIENLSNSMDLSFIGVKIGDVNGNAKGANANQGNTESRSTLKLTIDDRKVFKGEILEIPVLIDNATDFYGLQAQINANGLIIRDMKNGVVKINPTDFVMISSNQVSIALANGAGQRIPSGKSLFVLEVEVLRNGNLSEMLTLGADLNAEAYAESMDVKALSLNWRSDNSGFNLTSVSPNPWNAQTEIQFELPEAGMVTFKVRDYTGRKVISSIDQYAAGQNSIRIQRADLGTAGVYVYEIRFGEKVLTGKMILID
jgi:hypothetical protein